MAVVVREADTDADWAGGLKVLEAVYVGEGYTPSEQAHRYYRRDVLEEQGSFLVAILNGGVVGVVLFLAEGSALHQCAEAGEREFRFLAVLPGARGAGAGEALVRACIERARGAIGLVLWTRPVMLAAQRLYERTGFERLPDRDSEDPRGFQRLVFRLKPD